MTRPLIVNIPHTLGREEATRRLKRGLARASSAIPIVKIEEETWSGDHLSFKVTGMGQVALGTAEVNDADVRIEVVLPWLLQRLGEMVHGAIPRALPAALRERRDDEAVRFGERVDKQHKPRATPPRFRRSKAVSAAAQTEGRTMSVHLPSPIGLYVKIENSGDIEALSDCFASNATVRDEGHTYEGLAAIKEWKAETKKKYNHTIAPLEVTHQDEKTVLQAKLTGNFPGSPVTLEFSFVLESGKIVYLEIH